MSKKIPYIRVGTTYYKIIEKPLISGDTTSVLVRWNRETIISDHGKTFLSSIPKYDGFCCIPEHLDYQQYVTKVQEIPIRRRGRYVRTKLPFDKVLQFHIDYYLLLIQTYYFLFSILFDSFHHHMHLP